MTFGLVNSLDSYKTTESSVFPLDPLQFYLASSVCLFALKAQALSESLRSQGHCGLFYVEVQSFARLDRYFIVKVCVSDADKQTLCLYDGNGRRSGSIQPREWKGQTR